MKVLLIAFLVFSNGFLNTQNDLEEIVIIEDKKETSNTIWYQESLDLSQDFELQFSINLGKPSLRGDGATVIFNAANNDKNGYIGGVGGLIGALDLPHSLIFEMDTYLNLDHHNKLESDVDTGLKSNQNNGHLGIIETNNTKEIKHQQTRYSEKEMLGDGSVRDVFVGWNANTKMMYFSVEGYEIMEHFVDIESVFDGHTKVDWGFSSANGVATTNVSMRMIQYPHQVNIKSINQVYNEDLELVEIRLEKRIKNDLGSFSNLYLSSEQGTILKVLVNGKSVSFEDNLVMLEQLTDQIVDIEVFLDHEDDVLESTLTYEYQGFSDFIKVVNPPSNPDDGGGYQEPDLPDKPDVPDKIVKPPLSEIPNGEDSLPIAKIPEKETPVIKDDLELKPVHKPFKPIIPKTEEKFKYVLNTVNYLSGKVTVAPQNKEHKLKYIFDSGEHGVFEVGLNRVETEVLSLPILLVDEGYEFIGYFVEDEMIDLESVPKGVVMRAKYSKLEESLFNMEYVKKLLLMFIKTTSFFFIMGIIFSMFRKHRHE